MQNDKLYAQKDEKLHEQEDNNTPADRMILSSAGYQGLEDSFDFGDELDFDHDLEEHFTPPPPTSHPVQRDLFWPLEDDAPLSSHPPSSDHGGAWGDAEPKHSALGRGYGNGKLSRVQEGTLYRMNSDAIDRNLDAHDSQGFASNTFAGSHHDGGFLRRNYAGLQSTNDTFNGERLVGTLLTSNRDLPDYREMERLSERRRGQFEPYADPRWNPDEANHEGTSCSKSLWSLVPASEAEAETKDTEEAVRKARSQSLTSSFGALSLPRVAIDDPLEPLPLHPGDRADDASVDRSLEPRALDQHPRDPDGADFDFDQPPVKRRRPSPAMDAQPLEEPPKPAPRLKQRPTQLLNVNEEDIDDHDVLLGRGGKTNHHPGNAEYLQLIQEREVEYMLLGSRNEKTVYAMGLVQQLREKGIRFLKRDQKNKKLWNDVGDDKMREKVSQNLRERQPQLRKKMELSSDKGQQEKSPERKPRLEKSSQMADSTSQIADTIVAMETPSQEQPKQQPPVMQPLEEEQQCDETDNHRNISMRLPQEK